VGERVQHGLAHAADQVGDGRIVGKTDAQGYRADEVADDGRKLRPGTACRRRADDDIVCLHVAMQERLERSQHHNVRRGARLFAELSQAGA